jgi:hypothetical protein
MAMQGIYMRRVYIFADRKITEQVHSFKYDQPLLYGSKTWMSGNQNRKHRETSQVRHLRLILGFTMRDKMRNEHKREHLETENITEESRQYQRNWKEHVERLTSQCLSWQT